MLYQLITEDKNREMILSILDQHFGDYTITPALRRWKGKNEPSLTISIAWADPAKVQQAAEEIKLANSQEAILIIQHDLEPVTV